LPAHLRFERRSKAVKKKKTNGEQALEPLKATTGNATTGLPARSVSGGIKKEYLKSKKTCKVTFKLPRIAAPKAKDVCIVGDFNSWNIYANPMKKLKTGDYTITLELEPGREYQFRYLIDGAKWENDWNADKYVRSPFGDSDNSVIVV
jgi:1,4-alpha-glucan branching enzyme